MKKILLAAVAIVAAVVVARPLAASAAPEFLSYEGRNAIHEGQGGDKKTVNGIDFWSDGDPPHRYKVIGSISDRRMETGLYGMIRMSGLAYDIAKAAAAAGGNAVILEREGEDLLGVGGFSNAYASGNGYGANAFGSSFSGPIKAHMARYIVVQYLPDDPGIDQGTPNSGASGQAGAPIVSPPSPGGTNVSAPAAKP